MVTTSIASLKTIAEPEVDAGQNVTDTGVCRWLSEAEASAIYAAMSDDRIREPNDTDDNNEVRCRRCNMFTTSARRMCCSCQRDLSESRTSWFAKLLLRW